MMKQVLLLITGLLFASSGIFAQQEWEELVVNGDFEGSDFSSFSIQDYRDGSSQDLTADDIVVDENDANNHCAKVTNVTPRYSCFVIKLAKPLSEGDIFNFSIRAKSSLATDVTIYSNEMGAFLVKTGGEWSTFSCEGVVSNELAGSQTITFKLGGRKNDIFYFDDISMKVTDGNFPIEFADAKVKEICVSNWDTNGDGELSYAEAAVVEELGNAFRYNLEITSFDELQYFIGLTFIDYSAFFNTSLNSIIIPKNVLGIGERAFYNCQLLTSLTLGNSITTIGNEAFRWCLSLTSVTFPNSVESIGELAFYDCYSITKLNIPNSVKTIGEGAFQYCSGLTSIVVDEGNSVYDSRGNCNALIQTKDNLLIIGCKNSFIPSNVTSIGDRAFNYCRGMKSLTIPNSVTSISEGAFGGCSDLTSIIVEEGNPAYDSRGNCNAIISTADNKLIAGCENTVIPSDVVSIGNSAFHQCGLKSISIPDGVTSIGDYAFNGCQDLASINIPNSVVVIGRFAFIGTAWYNSQPDGLVYAGNVVIDYKGDTPMPENTEIVIKEGTLGIATGAFYFSNNYFGKPSSQNMYNLTSVTLPISLVYIGDEAFKDIYGLTSITIPDGVTTMGELAFANCALKSVSFGKGLTSIGDYAFAGCTNLAEVFSYIAEPFEINKNVFVSDWESIVNATLYVPIGTKTKYETTSAWNLFQSIVEMGIEPVEQGETIDIGTEIDENTNLEGTVVGDVYYCISSGDGSYDSEEGCIVVTKPTDDSAIDGKDIFGEDFKAGYTGFVFMVAPGKGSIKVEAETTGNMVLKVKVGDNSPTQMEVDGKTKVSFAYDVSEPTLVYIYGSISAAGAKGMMKAAGTDALKIYGIEVTSETDGIKDIKNEKLKMKDSPVYNLNGQQVEGQPMQKGVYIKDGKKVLVK